MNRCRWNGEGGNRGGPAIRLVRARVGGCVASRWHRRCRRAALLLVLPLVSGCFSPPRRALELMGNPPTPPVPAEVPTHVDQAMFSVDCWKQSGELEPQDVLQRGRRVVVTEFDVEFVDYQLQLPTPRQPIFKGPPISINPVHMAMSVIGVGRRYSQMAEEQQQALASDLYNVFLQDLRQRGLELVSQDDLHASPTYAELRKKPVVKSSPLMVLNPLGSDTGIAMHTRTVRSVPGSAAVPRGGPTCLGDSRGANPPGDPRGRGPRRAAPSRHLSRAAGPRAPQRDSLDHVRGIDHTPSISLAGLGPRRDRCGALLAHRRTHRTARFRGVHPAS